MRASWGPAVLGLVLLVLAGCSGDAKKTAAQAFVAPSATVSGGLGGDSSIVGTVIDDEEVVVEGADVGIAELGIAARTDGAGSFAFLNLPGGTYTLHAIRIGFKDLVQVLTLNDGEDLEATFRLEPVPSMKPWQETVTKAGHLQAGYRILTPAYGEGRAVGDVEYDWKLTDRPDALEAMVVELHWQGTQAFSKGMRMRVEVNGQANVVAKSFAILEGPSPIIHTVNATKIKAVLDTKDAQCKPEGPCTIQWRCFTGTGNTGNPDLDFGLMVEQTFNGYATMFYRKAPPESFSAAG